MTFDHIPARPPARSCGLRGQLADAKLGRVIPLSTRPAIQVSRVPGTLNARCHRQSSSWVRAVEAWPDYATYQAKTDRQIPVFVLEPMA